MLKAIGVADKKDKIVFALCVLIFIYGLILSIFVKYRTPDEALYLQETMLISELFKQGKWIGDYGVGVHGFLFKIPPAIIFLFTGPSVIPATMFNVFLASLSCWIFYKIQRDLLKFGWWAVLGCFFLIITQTFIFVFPTYLREIPSLFSLLLFFYLFLKKGTHDWTLGLLLVLVLDAKEYAFFNLAAAFIIWTFINFIEQMKGSFIKTLKLQFLIITKVFLPSILFIFLMLFTNIIPLNIFVPFVMGATEKNNFIQYVTKYSKRATEPIQTSPAPKQNRLSSNNVSGVNFKLKTLAIVIKNYIEALLNPKSFGLTSIPFFASVPAVYLSLALFRKDKTLRLFSLYQNIYIVTYLSQFNQSRYLFPTYMTLIIFFIYYLKENTKKRCVFILTLTIAILTALQLRGESILVIQKILFYTFLISMLLVYKLSGNHKVRAISLSIFIFVYPSVALINETLRLSEINSSKQVQIGQNRLVKFYSKDTYLKPEVYWNLKSWVPKKRMLRTQ